MKTTLEFEVQVRPHAESIAVNGVHFTSPEDLWAYLHQVASAQMHKPARVRQSTFITEDAIAFLLRQEATVIPTKATELQSNKSDRTLEEMGL